MAPSKPDESPIGLSKLLEYVQLVETLKNLTRIQDLLMCKMGMLEAKIRIMELEHTKDKNERNQSTHQ